MSTLVAVVLVPKLVTEVQVIPMKEQHLGIAICLQEIQIITTWIDFLIALFILFSQIDLVLCELIVHCVVALVMIVINKRSTALMKKENEEEDTEMMLMTSSVSE